MKCKYCQNDISDKAVVCSYCGRTLDKWKDIEFWFKSLSIVAVLVGAAVSAFSAFDARDTLANINSLKKQIEWQPYDSNKHNSGVCDYRVQVTDSTYENTAVFYTVRKSNVIGSEKIHLSFTHGDTPTTFKIQVDNQGYSWLDNESRARENIKNVKVHARCFKGA